MIDYEERKQARLEKLGSNDPKCGTCGEDDWRCLELHHLGDHGSDDLMVIVCRNCHRKLSDDQRDHLTHGEVIDPLLHRVGRFLLGLADLLALVLVRLREFAMELIARGEARAEGGVQ
jgi:hypothetical protein